MAIPTKAALRDLIELGKEHGYLTLEEINRSLTTASMSLTMIASPDWSSTCSSSPPERKGSISDTSAACRVRRMRSALMLRTIPSLPSRIVRRRARRRKQATVRGV